MSSITHNSRIVTREKITSSPIASLALPSDHVINYHNLPDSNWGLITMSDPKPETVSGADSTEPESESLPKETVESATESAPSPKVEPEPATESEPVLESDPAPAESQTDETQEDNEPEPSTSQPDEPIPVDDQITPDEPPKEEPVEPEPEENKNIAGSDTVDADPGDIVAAESERKQSSASEKSASERKQSSASDKSAAERKQSSASDKLTSERKLSSASEKSASGRKQSSASDKSASERKQSSASDKLTSERKQSSASDKSASERKQSSSSDKQEMQQRKKSVDTETNDELQKMIKELSEPKVDESSAKPDNKLQTGKETTENLISVLEDGMESQAKEKPATESAPPAAEAAPPVKPSKPKKYLYKLKSKTGKILHYTSTVPITLKRPIIHLTKMADTSSKPSAVQNVISSERDEVDSDNSNVKENEAPNDNVMKVIRKKGRPPLSSRPTPPVITLDGNASDTSEDTRNKSAPSFSMQTRKRQLKFLPDGRLITPQKRVKSDDKNQSSSSSDSDIDIISDSEKSSDPLSSNKPFLARKLETSTGSNASSSSSAVPHTIASTSMGSMGTPKKLKPEIFYSKTGTGEKRTKYKKVFDYESYYREKTGAPATGLLRTPVGNRSFASNITPIRKITDTPKLKPILPSSVGATKKASSVDPAQLLSSLIGVPISSGQLNVVKFKPKIIQERTNTIIASTPKKVTFEDDRSTKYGSANPSELLKSTPFKIVSKPAYQKILPKPTGNERTSITQTRMAYQHINIDNKLQTPIPASNSLYVASNSPFLRESLRDTLAKFETFSDSKVVKTKEGPKRAVKKKIDEDIFLKDNNTKTLYDLMYEIFEKMPSWNLHVVPDTNCFCIAQVSRGRMGIPTLKKSIEINSEFFAKVYVHQLQCKRYDGIYDTESKIIKLIKEIDALAA